MRQGAQIFKCPRFAAGVIDNDDFVFAITRFGFDAVDASSQQFKAIPGRNDDADRRLVKDGAPHAKRSRVQTIEYFGVATRARHVGTQGRLLTLDGTLEVVVDGEAKPGRLLVI